MQVTVKVSTDLGQVLHQRSPPTAESEALLNTVQASGLSLDPMHPGTEDPNLMTYFIVVVPDQARAQHLITRLRQLKGVEAAYLKPPDELP